LGQLKSAIYARMEEVSFRSGVAVAGGVLAAAGVAVALTIVLGGHGDAAASAPASPAAAASAASSSPVPAFSSPRATPRPSDTTVPATVAGEYRPPTPARASAWARAHRAAATTPLPGSTLTRRPFSRRWLPSWRDLRGRPGWRGWHRPHGSWHKGL
jgi:hypothetical protein